MNSLVFLAVVSHLSYEILIKTMEERVKRFISLYVPITSCNFRCHYCYITHNRLFDRNVPDLKYSNKEIRTAFSIKRLGGTCLINICGGGETLLVHKVVDYIYELLSEGHYVMVVTNGMPTRSFDRLSEFPKKLLERLFFKFSFHFIELRKKGLFDKFFSNIRKMRDAGASFTLELTPSDELIPFIDEVKRLSVKELGAVCHVTVARDERQKGALPILTEHSISTYSDIWSAFGSQLFDYKMKIFGEKRREFCYAGDWSFLVHLGTGKMQQCYCSYVERDFFRDMESPLKLFPIGNNCKLDHCYNGHAFLALGTIPSLKAPSFESLRNRITEDENEWLSEKMKNFMGTNLLESNQQLSTSGKFLANLHIYRFRLEKKLKGLVTY